MDSETHPHLDIEWRELLSRLPANLDLDQSARDYGALKRRRIVRDGATMLRLALAYGPGGMSLRSAAAWAAGCGIADLSDVGLLKRLKGADDWLSYIAASLLGDDVRTRQAGRRLRVVDGSVIRSSGKGGTSWRLHATYDPAEGRFSQLEINDTHGGESLSRHTFEKGDLVLADRGYARTPGLLHVREMGADFIMRIGWSTIRLLTPNGARLDWSAYYAGMQPGQISEHEVLVDYSGHKRETSSASTFRARLIIRRKDEAASERTRKAIWFDHRRKQRVGAHPNPLTVASADFLLLLTSVPAREMPADHVIAAYRLRWQIELAFKRLKSGLGIDALPARDSQLARSWLAAYLIFGSLIDEAVADSLAFPPCVAGTAGLTPVVVADAKTPEERTLGRNFRRIPSGPDRSMSRGRRQDSVRATSATNIAVQSASRFTHLSGRRSKALL
ncbi:transposase [Sphingomonas sp. QA11]|uniref:transposase n=1 Tax=Sphingomonas sp. QA11 TaxID=2950605 RepID=UPI00234A51ED|nr:transposase [Sphingomonas sp. QA11]WCM25875.1 transposase [Sphingomonas sp. QA11]